MPPAIKLQAAFVKWTCCEKQGAAMILVQNNIVIVWCINNEKQTRFSFYKTNIRLSFLWHPLRCYWNIVYKVYSLCYDYSQPEQLVDLFIAYRRIVIGCSLQRL